MTWLVPQKPRNSSKQKFIKQTEVINIQINKKFNVLMTSSRSRHQHDYRLIDVCFHKNLEIHVSYSILKKQKHSGFKEKYYYSDAVIMLKSST